MNPWPVVKSSILQFRHVAFAFTGLILVGTAMTVGILAQQRAVEEASARAAEKFDVIVAPQGSRVDALLTGVYLQPGSSRLISPETTARLLNLPDVDFASPLAFGDNVEGSPIVGVTDALVAHLSSGALSEGSMFAHHDEAVVGASVAIGIGASITPTHGMIHMLDGRGTHEETLAVVGRMARTHSPWDDAVLVPVEFVWEVHEHDHAPADGEEAHAHDDHSHEHEDGHDHDEGEQMGGPYSNDNPGVPAVVLKVSSVPDAYRLRDEFNNDETMAFFPAEVLVDLYQTLGDVSFVLVAVSAFSQALVLVAVITGVFVVFRLLTPQLVTLRALGAPRRYIFVAVAGFIGFLVTVGVVLGLLGGLGAATALSAVVEARTNFALSPTLGSGEVAAASAIWLVGIASGLLPAWWTTRRPLSEAIRDF